MLRVSKVLLDMKTWSWKGSGLARYHVGITACACTANHSNNESACRTTSNDHSEPKYTTVEGTPGRGEKQLQRAHRARYEAGLNAFEL
jgi:hypothetical protein